MEKTTKKRSLTDEERRECDALNALYKAKKKALGITQEKIALEGLRASSQSAASHYLTGRNALNAEAAAVFSRYLQEPVEAFSPRLAEEIRRLAQSAVISSEHANVVPVATIPRKRTKYPVISWVRAGDWAESPDNFQPGDADEWLESEEKAGLHGYWLVVDGDSMTPLFPPGSRILVQPEGFDLISGKYYVAIYYESGRKRDTTVKQYVRDVGFEYLKPLNPTYRTLDVNENVRIIGRVIDYKLPPGVL